MGVVTSSGVDQAFDHALVMDHFDHVLLMDEAAWPALVPDICIVLGDHLTSKRIGRFIEYCVLEEHGRCVVLCDSLCVLFNSLRLIMYFVHCLLTLHATTTPTTRTLHHVSWMACMLITDLHRPATHVMSVGPAAQRNDPSHVLAAHMQAPLLAFAATLPGAGTAAGAGGGGELQSYCSLLKLLDETAASKVTVCVFTVPLC